MAASLKLMDLPDAASAAAAAAESTDDPDFAFAGSLAATGGKVGSAGTGAGGLLNHSGLSVLTVKKAARQIVHT